MQALPFPIAANTHIPRIAVVAPGLAILGGQGIQAAALMKALTDSGFHVDFIPINPVFPFGLRWLRNIPYLRTALNQLLYRWQLRRIRYCDRVHLFSASYWSFVLCQIPAIRAATRYGKPVTLNYHSGEAGDHLRRWGRWLHPWLQRVDRIVVPSRYLQQIFASHGYHTQVIANMIQLDQFSYRMRKPLQPRLLSIRNLEPIYGVDNTLEAFSRIKQQLPDATLTIAGYGSQAAALRRTVAEKGLSGVRFLGRVEPEDVARVYDSCDIFLNSSVVDNQPVSILESFAAGLPVVSTPTGDIANMIETGTNGMLVPPNDPQAMAEAVLWLLNHPREARRMARSARHSAASYTWRTTASDWILLCSGDKP